MIELMLRGLLATLAVYAVSGIIVLISNMINSHRATNIMLKESKS